jgi:hypothetical protein
LYPVATNKPRQILLSARGVASRAGSCNYPFVESAFQDATIQPYIHDCTVRVHEGKHAYLLRIFFKRHCRLPLNQALPGNRTFRGDAVVVRAGAVNSQAVVSMRERDTILSDFVIKK